VTDWPVSWLAATPGAACPACGARTGRRIVYGEPSDDVLAALDARSIDIELGGCCVSPDDPNRSCSSCAEQFALAGDPIDD
jgi:hypothetical protein